MYGVMMPDISAGSNHVGASEMCTPRVSCPSAPTALAGPGAAASRAKARRANIARRALRVALRPWLQSTVESVGTGPIGIVDMASPLRSRTENAKLTPCRIGPGAALHAQRTTFFSCLGREARNQRGHALGCRTLPHRLPGAQTQQPSTRQPVPG